ncbi:uncharacterized protein LOC118484992 [Helianthus annuus]|uniref:uncharacterized protein LOC118484992 n=1 Tax=Helianthus annuus TaxID=4232 RepID=UPI001652F266|nr:uncharacterized protein LOC118484992 [Helianthus annuus]
MECLKDLKELEGYKLKDIKQRSRARWDLDGNENSCSFMDRLRVEGKGTIATGCSSSFITFIPKNKDPVGMKEYRPINLIGVISKTISKILANRLKLVIGTIISENQTTFLKGMYILDSPLILNELIAWMKKYNKKAFLLKIDFEKAYDNISWSFLLDIMGQMGFSDLWCKWIKGILASARSAVLVNGSPTFEFNCYKGVRQGDPLSPFLFLLVMEALSSILGKARTEGLFKGEWDRDAVKNVARCLRIFYLCSGLKINLKKSNIYGLGVDNEAVSDMAKAPAGVLKSLEAKMRKFLWAGNGNNSKMNWVSWDGVTWPKAKGGLGISRLKEVNEALLVKWGWRYRAENLNLWCKLPESEEELKEWKECCEVLNGVRISNGKDVWFWKDDSQNGFSVKEVKAAMINDRGSRHPPNFVWCKWVPIKCNIMNWRGNLDRLPTRLDLKRRDVDIPSVMCPFCDEVEESVEHLFTACSVALRVWSTFSVWCNITPLYLFEFKDIFRNPQVE